MKKSRSSKSAKSGRQSLTPKVVKLAKQPPLPSEQKDSQHQAGKPVAKGGKKSLSDPNKGAKNYRKEQGGRFAEDPAYLAIKAVVGAHAALQGLVGVAREFSEGDISDHPGLLKELREGSNLLSQAIRGHLPGWMQMGSGFVADDREWRLGLAACLNNFLKDDPSWDGLSFAGVSFPESVRTQKMQNPKGRNRTVLRRWLLEHSYPKMLKASSPKECSPGWLEQKVGRFTSSVKTIELTLANITGKLETALDLLSAETKDLKGKGHKLRFAEAIAAVFHPEKQPDDKRWRTCWAAIEMKKGGKKPSDEELQRRVEEKYGFKFTGKEWNQLKERTGLSKDLRND